MEKDRRKELEDRDAAHRFLFEAFTGHYDGTFEDVCSLTEKGKNEIFSRIIQLVQKDEGIREILHSCRYATPDHGEPHAVDEGAVDEGADDESDCEAVGGSFPKSAADSVWLEEFTGSPGVTCSSESSGVPGDEPTSGKDDDHECPYSVPC